MENWIRRFTLVDRPNQPILVRCSRKEGGHALDIDLVATDGNNVFRGKVRYGKLQRYRSSTYDGSEDEWLNLIQFVLLLKPDTTKLPTSLRDNIEGVCNTGSGESKSTLSIVIRTRIEDITHKLGAIDLKYSENTDDVDLFAWMNEDIQFRDVMIKEVKRYQEENQKARDTIQTLEKQFQDLFEAKENHETELLTNFALLLNEKKLRIRAQQRQLAEKEQLEKWKPPKKNATAVSKRKAVEESVTNDNDSDESEAFQKMNIDHSTDMQSNADLDETMATASERDESLEGDPDLSTQNSKTSRLPSRTPPPRNLPFSVQPDRKSPPNIKIDAAVKDDSVVKDDDETASDDDDEL